MNKKDFLVVGIGTSAGGVTALKDFFSKIPDNTGVAFIIVQHLKRDYPSQLTNILSKFTGLSVVEIRGGELVQPNIVYIMPEGKKLEIHNGLLKLVERPIEEVINKAIDHFFFSLAEDMKGRAIGVILSGTGSDGVRGVKKIEDEGGIVIVQDPSTAQFDGMPQNTIHLDHPDFVLPPEKIFFKVREIMNSQ